ncbi:hypothetical protein [Stenoxybacter acetivorans]|nr:hypothetical protein [Stenoxybacter acetivorans]
MAHAIFAKGKKTSPTIFMRAVFVNMLMPNAGSTQYVNERGYLA